MKNRIPVAAAQRVAEQFDLTQCLLIGWDGTNTHIVTYGRSKADCEAAAQAQEFWAGRIREFSFEEKPEGRSEDAFLQEVRAARDVWLAENDPRDGTDCVTPFDRFLYGVKPEANASPVTVPEEKPCEAWRQYTADFDGMDDAEIEMETRTAENNLDEAESWLEAVRSWEAAGKPRNGVVPAPAEEEPK